MHPTFTTIKRLYTTYERWLSMGALATGFVIDNLTLQRIDLLFENLVLVSYLVIAGMAIVYLNLYESGRLRGRVAQWLRLIAPLGMQFAFGGLFSGFVIFYFRSASVGASWPFLLFLVVIFIGNEFFVKQFVRMSFQVSVFFIALFSFAIFYVPIVVGSIGTMVFLLSGLVSLASISLFVWLLSVIHPPHFQESKLIIVGVVGAMYILINVAYFTNLIPPIPLSLKESALAYTVTKTEMGEYSAVTQATPWYRKLLPQQTLLIHRGMPLYLYSAVFAPTDLATDVVHEWQFKNEHGNWETSSRVQFPIVGGRDGGYRGYSIKHNLIPGEWRVNIETLRGQVIGRVWFTLQYSNEPLPREQQVYF